jgi:hypothetical protein
MLLTVAMVVIASTHAAVPANQVAALNELFASTNGTGWTANYYWGVGDPCTNGGWFGLQCSDGVLYAACSAAVRVPS